MKAKHSLSTGAVLLSLAAALSGCASNKVPTSDIAVSKTAIDSAISAGGAEFAPVELKTAQDKLDQAEKLVAKHDDYDVAQRLAEESAADAKLAESKALAAKAQKSVQENQEGQRALQEEINRGEQQ